MARNWYMVSIEVPIPFGDTEDEDYTFCLLLMMNTRMWRNMFRLLVLDSNLIKMENRLYQCNYSFNYMKCLQCCSPLKWISHNSANSNETTLMCAQCPNALPILKCEKRSSTKILGDLLKYHNPQIISSSLKLLCLSGHFLNSLSPPHISDNPVQILKSIFDTQPDSLKLGGKNCVVIADIYLPNDNEFEYPILFLSDTIISEPVYIFHVLKIKSEYFNSNLNKTNHDQSKYFEKCLINELCEIANLYIKCDSFLVLGKILQNFISPNYYNNNKSNKKHNLSYIVPLSNLRKYDHHKRFFTITENYDKIIEPIENICKIVISITENLIKEKTSEQFYNYLMLHFNVIMWLIHLHETPFETMIFHLIQMNRSKI